MTMRYNHRRLSPEEFSALRARADLTVDDFLYLTGRRRDQLEHFLLGRRKDYIPTMTEVLMLELAILRGPALIKDMFDVTRRYDAGPQANKTGGHRDR